MSHTRHHDAHNHVPALVIGDGLTVLGVVRSLADARIPSFCLSENLGFELHSRWCRRTPERIGSWGSVRDLTDLLERSPFSRAVLIACSDHWTVELAKLDPSLTDRFRTCLPPGSVIEQFVDKSRFGALLRETGVPHPFTEPLVDDHQLARILRGAPDGAFIKPVDSQRFLQHFGVKAFQISSLDDAIERFGQARRAGLDVVLQEYVAGAPDRHVFVDGFVDRHHRIAASFARKRLRMFPPDFGNSTYMKTIAPESAADALGSLEELFARAGYRGIFSAEFKFDEWDGRFKLLEVNTRPWWYVEFATACGLNVVEMAYRDALELAPVPTRSYRVGVGLVHSYYDYHACRSLRAAGGISIAAWIRSWLTSKRAIFRWDDPMPAVASVWGRIRGRLR